MPIGSGDGRGTPFDLLALLRPDHRFQRGSPHGCVSVVDQRVQSGGRARVAVQSQQIGRLGPHGGMVVLCQRRQQRGLRRWAEQLQQVQRPNAL